MTRLYIAGPMTGLPDFNHAAFHSAAKVLRALGHEALNPAENPAPPCGTWAAYMRMALAQLVQCDCIVLLPGWTESKGALIERKLAQVLGMEVVRFSYTTPMKFKDRPAARKIAGLQPALEENPRRALPVTDFDGPASRRPMDAVEVPA